MKILVIITILLLPILTFAQESADKERKFSIGLNVSPNYSYRTLKHADDLQGFVDSREESEQPSFGFNIGIGTQYLITKNLEFQLGFQFSRQAHMFSELSFTDNIGSGLQDIQFRYHYLEVPLQINYRIVNQKFFGYITGGVSINRLLNDMAISSLTYNNGETEIFESESGFIDFNETGISVIGGIGLGYHLNKKINLRLEPIFRHSFNFFSRCPY